jgi:hypothetical protein
VSEFTYIDIFATKGIEYLLVIGFFLVLVAFWSFLNIPKKEIRKAQEEREELRRLLDVQRDRMDAELDRLRGERESMQYALLAQFQLAEQRAIAAWHAAHPEESVPPDLPTLLDWVLADRNTLVEDRRRLDYLTELVAGKPTLYRTPGADGAVCVDAGGKGFGEGGSLREAIDAARRRRAA